MGYCEMMPPFNQRVTGKLTNKNKMDLLLYKLVFHIVFKKFVYLYLLVCQ